MKNGGLPGEHASAGGRLIERDGDFLSGKEGVRTVEIERMQPQSIGRDIEQGQACVVMMNHSSQRRDDAAKKVAKLAAGDQDVVDVEQDL